jgi:hypothetical protein
MLRMKLVLAMAVAALVLAVPTKALAWGVVHGGYTHVGPAGVYHVGYTRAGGYGYGGYGGYGLYRGYNPYGGFGWGGNAVLGRSYLLNSALAASYAGSLYGGYGYGYGYGAYASPYAYGYYRGW